MTIFLILGYGVPKDIFKDEKYNMYLKLAFNKIFDEAYGRSAHIVFCGGRTDSYKPYVRTEADEMIKLFRALKHREFVQEQTREWKLIAERKSLSTLENLLFANDILLKKPMEYTKIAIFHETTRTARIRKLASKVFFGKVQYIPLDFNQSSGRYYPKKYILKKEEVAMSIDLKVLNKSLPLSEYHKIYQEKFELMRQTPPKDREEVIRLWWDRKLGTSVNKYL